MMLLDVEAEEEEEVKRPRHLNPEEWDTWCPAFENYLKALKGRAGTPLFYIIRNPNLTTDDFQIDDHFNQLVYAVALNGPFFEADNARVAREIFSFIAGTAAANFVDENSNDGRGMWHALSQHYDGPGEVQKRYNKAKENLRGLHYSNEVQMSWSEFVSRYLKCMDTFEKARQPKTNIEKMEILMEKIKDTNLNAVKEVARDRYADNIIGAMNYIGERVSEIHSAAIRARQRTQGRGQYVSSTTSSSSRGGRGRGGGNWRGGRGGRGYGRGRGNYGRCRPDRYNEVDISDPTRYFRNDERAKLGYNGMMLVRRLRQEIREERRAREAAGGGGNRSLEARISALEMASVAPMSEVTMEVPQQQAVSAAQPQNPQAATVSGNQSQGAGSTFGRGRHMNRGRGGGRPP